MRTRQSLLAILCATAAFFCQAEPLSGAAHDFTLKTNQGNNLRLAEQRGNVVLLNFWASWCGPCRQEMPKLDELYQRYQSAGFIVLGVNVETDSAAADKLLKKIPVSFPILYDSDSRVSQHYKIDAMPTSVLIDRSGQMRYLHRGYIPGYEELYRQQIKELIKE